jgi:hypothetical protein
MLFSLEPAAHFASQLNHLIIKATYDTANEWFFYDGAHNGGNSLEQNTTNSWLHENFVAVGRNKEIIGYFEGMWSRPVDVIVGFRAINFCADMKFIFTKALFTYFEYLFINRGCKAFNWTVAHKNEYAMKQYDRFVCNYCGHFVGIRHYAHKSYTGKISDINLYEITREEYLEWKERGFRRRPDL